MEAVSELCKALTQWKESVGKPAMDWTPGQPEVKLQADTAAEMQQLLRQVYSQPRGECTAAGVLLPTYC